MPREKHIEQETCRRLNTELHVITLKIGHDGWPDRQVLLGRARHIWFEFKQPGAKLRPGQERRVLKLQRMGEVVYVVEDVARGLEIVRGHLLALAGRP